MSRFHCLAMQINRRSAGVGGEKVLKNLKIENDKIFLDDEELPNVNAYKLENSADSQEPAKLTVTMYVNVGQVCSG